MELKVCVLLFLLLSADFVWILLDRSVWMWDPAIYGSASVRLWRTLLYQPFGWPRAMLSVFPEKAPLLYWVGQFFVPFGGFLGSVDFGLLFLVFLAGFFSIVLLFEAFERFFYDRRISFVGCVVVASAPIFVGMVTHYYVEVLQLFGVVWFLYILASMRRWNSLFVFLNLVSASFFLLLVKVSSPVYCVWPGLFVLGHLWRRGFSDARFDRRVCFMFCLSVLLAGAVVLWYGLNFSSVFHFVGNLPHNALGGFVRNVVLWLKSSYNSFFVPEIFVALVLLSLFLLFCSGLKAPAGYVWHIPVLQFASFIVFFAWADYWDARYLTALLPYLALLVCGVLSAYSRRHLVWVVLALFIIQWLAVTDFEYGASTSIYSIYPPYTLTSVELNPRHQNALDNVVMVTCIKPAKPTRNLLGSDLRWLNPYSIAYQLEKKLNRTIDNYQCHYIFLGDFLEYCCLYSPGLCSVNDSWNLVQELKPDYYIMRNQTMRKINYMPFTHNQNTTSSINRIVRTSGNFTIIPLDSDEGIIVYENKFASSNAIGNSVNA